jgi:hypothetical protein
MYAPDEPGIYQGKQVIINSDRLLFNAKTDSILLYSNEAIGFSTNGSIHFDTSISDESKVVINSPNIYLGLIKPNLDLPFEPAVKGNELADYLAGPNGILDLIEDFIDVVTDNISYTSPYKGLKTAPNTVNDTYVRGLKKLIEELREKALADAGDNNFKSTITKLA